MLELRPTCEHCNKPLPPDALDARICTYECTFCATCVETTLGNVCPNCGGGFVPRPIRPSKNWKGDMGRKLESHLLQAGFLISKIFTLRDQELSFNGRAQPEVLEAWRNRFARMELLRRFCGARAHSVEDDFITCLGRDDHRSLANVYCCIANKPADA